MLDEIPVSLERRGGVALLTITRAARRNALSRETLFALGRLGREAVADPTVRAIVITGEGDKAFCAGADLKERQGMSADDVRVQVGLYRTELGVLDLSPKPVIAAINGHALGGGSELALCCDYRVMVEDGRSRIGQTESSLGIIPGAGGTQRLPRLIGKARAMRYLIESTRLSAREAEAVGWVDRAVAPDEFQGAVAELAGRLAKGATFAIAMIKDAVLRGQDLPVDLALAIESENFARASLTTDAAIGIMSFLSKQEPEFSGS